MPFKDAAARYITKNGKVYVDWLDIDQFWDDDGEDIPLNTKNARYVMTRDHPELTDFVFKKANEFFGYVVYVEANLLASLGKKIDLSYYQIKNKK